MWSDPARSRNCYTPRGSVYAVVCVTEGLVAAGAGAHGAPLVPRAACFVLDQQIPGLIEYLKRGRDTTLTISCSSDGFLEQQGEPMEGLPEVSCWKATGGSVLTPPDARIC